MKEELTISTDKRLLDVSFVHEFLTRAYWSKGRTMEQVKRSILHSLCWGMYVDTQQIGFARIVTDQVVFAYVMDVFVDPVYQGKGYGKKLVSAILNDPELAEVPQWYLKTKDAQGLYQQFGFRAIDDAMMWMKKLA